MKLFKIPEIIDDSFVIKFFSLLNSLKINPSRTKEKFINRFNIIKNYLNNRFTDSESYLETIYRIFNQIEEKPKCKNCGRLLLFHPTHHFREFCSLKCAQSFNEIKIKKYNTRLLQLINNPNYYNEINEKRKVTVFEKFGVEYASLSEIIKEKVKQTNIKNLGVPYTALSEKCKLKMKLTCLENYGVTHNFLIPEVKNNILEKWLEKYGTDNPMKNSEIILKNLESKKLHNTFNSSKIENKFYNYLLTIFNESDIQRQYCSIEYPFCSDFYITSLNLYIEIQGYWTHGKHAFDKNNVSDLNILELWKYKANEGKLLYKNAIETWTIIDVNKRNTARVNNINYLEIFSSDIKKIIYIFQSYINNLSNKNV